MNYRRLVPANSFLGRYLAYMQSQETASSFDFYCGLWCISAVCGRFTHVDRPRAPVYLNMFVILVGESGVARKTTSVKLATSVVRSVLGADKPIGLLDAKATPERLEEMLNDRTTELGHAQIAIAIPELAVFLGTEQYIAHMPTLLTDLYDCPTDRVGGGTIVRGSNIMRHVWVSFLSASTPVWLLKTVNPNVVEGGFTSRCYFVVSNEPKKRIPWPEDADADLFKDICDDVKIIHTEALERGPIKVHPLAIKAFSAWYHKREHALDPFRQSFEAREDAHVLRVAALLCINDGTWEIRRAHVNVALRLVMQLKAASGGIFENAEMYTKYAQALDIIRAQLMSSGLDPIQKHTLYRKCKSHVTNDEFLNLLEVLHEIGAIQRFMLRSEDGRGGRPAEYIRGTQLILSRGLGESVLDRFTV